MWFKGAWGVFGWRQLRLAPAAFFVLAVLCLAALVAAGVAIARGRVALDLPTVAFLVLAAVGLLLVLHVTEYRVIFVAKERGVSHVEDPVGESADADDGSVAGVEGA